MRKKIYCNKKNKNHCNNIRVIGIVDTKCYNKNWVIGLCNKKTFVAINSKYFNNNFDAMIHTHTHTHTHTYIYIYCCNK